MIFSLPFILCSFPLISEHEFIFIPPIYGSISGSYISVSNLSDLFLEYLLAFSHFFLNFLFYKLILNVLTLQFQFHLFHDISEIVPNCQISSH